MDGRETGAHTDDQNKVISSQIWTVFKLNNREGRMMLRMGIESILNANDDLEG